MAGLSWYQRIHLIPPIVHIFKMGLTYGHRELLWLRQVRSLNRPTFPHSCSYEDMFLPLTLVQGAVTEGSPTTFKSGMTGLRIPATSFNHHGSLNIRAAFFPVLPLLCSLRNTTEQNHSWASNLPSLCSLAPSYLQGCLPLGWLGGTTGNPTTDIPLFPSVWLNAQPMLPVASLPHTDQWSGLCCFFYHSPEVGESTWSLPDKHSWLWILKRSVGILISFCLQGFWANYAAIPN